MDDAIFSDALLAEFREADVPCESCERNAVDSMEADSDAESETDGENSDNDARDVVEADEAVEEDKLDEFLEKTCECKFGPKSTACSTLFDREAIAVTRMNCREMRKSQLDLVVLANLEAHQHPHAPRSHIDYYFGGRKVCRNFFLFVHSLGSKRFKNLVSHFTNNGLSSRTHGNTKRLPANTTPLTVTEEIVQFICNFAAVHALSLLGRIPGQFSDDKALLLPSDMSKCYVYRQYRMAVSTKGQCISRRKFETLWCQLLPHVSEIGKIRFM